MNARRPRGAQWGSRLNLLNTLGLGVLALAGVLTADLERTAAALIAFGLVTRGRLAGVIAAGLCFGFGEFEAGVLALIGVFASQLTIWSLTGARRDVDSEGLSTAFARLPPGLLADLRIHAAGNVLTTWHLVTWAREQAPGSWPAQSATPGPGEYDGALLQGGVTQFAAEAAVMSGYLAEAMETVADAQILGAAATCIPLSIADEMYRKPPVDEVLRMSDRQFADAFMTFGRSPLGGAVTARVERVMRLPAWQAEALPRQRIADLSPAQIALAPLATAGIYAWAVGSMILDGIKALRPRRTATTAPARAPQPPTAPVNRAQRPAGSTGSSSAAARGDASMTRVRAATGFWAGLPLVARTLWLSRSVLVLVALALPAALGAAPWWATLATLTAAGFRGVRRPAISVVVIAGLGPLNPLAAAALAARLVVGEVALRCCGRAPNQSRRASGVAQVVAARRRLANAADIEAESFDVELQRRTESLNKAAVDEDEQFEFAANLIGSAWVELRPRALIWSLLLLWRGGVLGRWGEEAAPPDMEAGVRQLYLLTEVGEFLIRAGLILASSTAAGLFAEPQPWPLAHHGLGTRLPAAAIAALVTKAGGGRPPALGTAAFWAIVAAVAMRSAAVLPFAIGIAGAALTQTAKSALEGGLIKGRGAVDWRPPRRTPRRLGARWKAAQQAADQGRFGLGIEMLEQSEGLAARPKDNRFDNDCRAQSALWLLEIGEIGRAARHVDQLEAQAPTALTAPATYALGLAQSRLGDDAGAAETLRSALAATRNAIFARRVAVSLAEVLARQDDPTQAVAVLSWHPPPALGAQGVATMIDAETAVAAALHRAGDEGAASSRLNTVLDFASFGDDPVGDRDRALADAQGRAYLLAGRWDLARRQAKNAEKHLDQALNWLKGGRDEYARATARVLHGCALTRLGRHDDAVASIEAGLQVLEARRTKLERGDRRATMIVAGEETYGLALTALSAANRAGLNYAGVVGAVLIESLRRSAISEALRQGPGLLDEALGPLADELAALDDDAAGEADVAQLRRRLAAQVSERFAEAYLPAQVTSDDVRNVARSNGHLLSFYVTSKGAQVWRAWMRPDGGATVEAVDVPDDPAHALSRLSQGQALSRLELFGPWDPDAGAFAELGEALLPMSLREAIRLSSREQPLPLLVVPDGYIAGVPWAALAVGGEPLVTKALLQLSPSVDLLGPTPTRIGAGRVLAFPDDGVVAQLGQAIGVLTTRGRDEFLRGLQSQLLGAYIGTHGERSGMDARVSFGGGEWLSAASALRYRWPDWVVFAACVVGRYEPQSGQEPLGLPISCMLGGASVVIAAVVEIAGSNNDDETAASRLAASVTEALIARGNPAHALRTAQLEYLAGTNMPTVGEGLGGVCLSSRRLLGSR